MAAGGAGVEVTKGGIAARARFGAAGGPSGGKASDDDGEAGERAWIVAGGRVAGVRPIGFTTDAYGV